MSIGKNINELRREAKLTQTQLAEKLGVTEQSVSKWECDVCAPDVSIFPALAEIFGVSIDRIYGFHHQSYEDAVKEIVKRADDSHDTYKEIEIIGEGLKKYPNSDELKIYHAFSLSMINRMSDDENEKKKAVDKAIKLCNEVVGTSKDPKQINDALHMLQRIYTETYQFDKAIEAVEKQSADRYCSRISGKASILNFKKDKEALSNFTEESVYWCWIAMHRCLESYTATLRSTGDYKEALKFHLLDKKLLKLFDDECADFNATYKIINTEFTAQCYKALGDKERCLAALKRFAELAIDVKNVAKLGDDELHPSTRCGYFRNTKDPSMAEEWMSDVFPEKALGKYDEFFADHEGYAEFKAGLTK